MNIGIVGSRRRDTPADKFLVEGAFWEVCEFMQLPLSEVTIISGGCPKGADRFAEELAKDSGIPIKIYYPIKPKWKNATYSDYVKSFFARNALVAKDCDILITCVAPDRKGGTEDTIKKFLKVNSENKLILI